MNCVKGTLALAYHLPSTFIFPSLPACGSTLPHREAKNLTLRALQITTTQNCIHTPNVGVLSSRVSTLVPEAWVFPVPAQAWGRGGGLEPICRTSRFCNLSSAGKGTGLAARCQQPELPSNCMRSLWRNVTSFARVSSCSYL